MLQSIRLWEREKFKDDDTLQRKRARAYLSLYFIQGFSHGLQRDTKRGFLFFNEFHLSDFTAKGKYSHRGKVHMERFYPSQANLVWYNVRIPYTRDEPIFDIDLGTGMEDELLFPGHRPEVTGRAVAPRPPPRDGRARSPSAPPTNDLGHTQQRMRFRGEAANFPQRKTKYDGASRGDTRRALYLVFRSGS